MALMQQEGAGEFRDYTVGGVVTAHGTVSWRKKEANHEEGERYCKGG